MLMDLGPDTDELYNSLKRLSNSTAMNTIRLRRFAPKPIPFKEEPPKQLTFSLSQVYFTNGKPRADDEMKSEVDEIVGERRDLYKKAVRVIGTALENCVISDMISIDIDPESTRLPLMCKLMIIVEGACVERGQRVLVRDAAVQIGDSLDGTANIMNASSQTTTNGYSDQNGHNIYADHNNQNGDENASLKASLAHRLENGENGEDLSAQSSSSRQIKLEAKSVSNEANKIKFTKVSSNGSNQDSVLDQPNFKIKIINNGENSVKSVSSTNGDANNVEIFNGLDHHDINGVEKPIHINTNGQNDGVWDYETMLNKHRGSTGGMTKREMYEKREYIETGGNLRHNLSTDNLNHIHQSASQNGQRQRRITENQESIRRHLERNTCGGSLCDLPSQLINPNSSSSTTRTTTTKSSYFSTRHADRGSSSFVDSYLGLNEYLSTPYYQYQCKNRAKRDFANSTYEDAIELGISIPIRRQFNDDEPTPVSCFQVPVHRNEKHIFISNETRPFVDSSTMRTFAHNMRRYLHERLSRFEAEVTFFRLNNESDDFMPQFRITSPFHYMDCELCRRGAFGGIGVLNAPMSSSYAYQYHRHHHHRANFGGGFATSGGPEFDTEANSKSEPSVTNLMYVQVIDGCLNI